jgi:hypothetical protein
MRTFPPRRLIGFLAVSAIALIRQSGELYQRNLGRNSTRFTSSLKGIPSRGGWTRVDAAKDQE